MAHGNVSNWVRSVHGKIEDSREKDFGQGWEVRDNTPGYDWFKGFMRRHPEIYMRESEFLPINREKGFSSEVLDRWFEGFTAFVTEHNLLRKRVSLECR